MKSNKKYTLEIILFAVMLIYIGSIIINKEIGDMDEIWNYNFANGISKGLVPYKDFSMIQTPLLPFINGLFLLVFPNSLLTFRILAVILCSIIFFMIYKILDKLKVNKGINIIIITILLFIYRNYLCIDYNYFSAFLTLLIVYFELTLNMNKKYNNVLIGIIGGLTFLTKQSIGAFVCISIVLYRLIFEIYKRKKYNEKMNIKNILYRILGGIIPAIILMVYLILNGAVSDFIDYAILGLQTFSNKISYINLINNNITILKTLSVYIPISFIIMLIYSIKCKDSKMLMILFLSLSMFGVVFPISDPIHFLIGIIPSIIGNVYMIYKGLKKIYSKKIVGINLFIDVFSKLMIIYIFILSISNIYLNAIEEKYYTDLRHFEGIPISEDYEKEIKNVEEYIKNSNNKVYILNFDAAMYMIPLDIYNKNYDMLMKGNFGSNGEKGLINNIKNEPNAIFLILNENLAKNWQHPKSVTEYIEKNLKHIGSIENFEIYTK